MSAAAASRESPGDSVAAAPSAVVVAGDEETRVLLRGLLKLHHILVVGEASSAAAADDLLRTHRPTFLLSDSNLVEGSLAWMIPAARTASPGTRIVLIRPHDGPLPLEGRAVPDATILRPFRLRDLLDALMPPPEAPPPDGGVGAASDL